jgi:DNA-binding MarR family transcriptional regulator
VGELTTVIEEFNSLFIRLPATGRLSFTTLSVLHTLSRRSPQRLSELTATERVIQSAITQLVTRLERDGLVERHPGPADGRAVLVQLTPAGAAVVAGRRASRVGRLAGPTGRLTLAERAAIAAALPRAVPADRARPRPVNPSPENRRALCLPGSASTASGGSAATSCVPRSPGAVTWTSWRSTTWPMRRCWPIC